MYMYAVNKIRTNFSPAIHQLATSWIYMYVYQLLIFVIIQQYSATTVQFWEGVKWTKLLKFA